MPFESTSSGLLPILKENPLRGLLVTNPGADQVRSATLHSL